MSVNISRVSSKEVTYALNILKLEFGEKRSYFNCWLQQIRNEIGTTRRLYKILVDDEEAGWLLIHFLGNRIAKFNALIVYPQFRNRKVGIETLNKAILDISPENDWIFTQCREDETIAIRLVERVGFIQIGTMTHIKEKSTNLIYAFSNASIFSFDIAKKLAEKIYNKVDEQIITTETDGRYI